MKMYMRSPSLSPSFSSNPPVRPSVQNGIEALGGTLKCETAGHPEQDQSALGIYAPFPTAATAMYYAGTGWYGATAAAGGVPGMVPPVSSGAAVPTPFVFIPPSHPHAHHPAAATVLHHPQQQGNHSFGHRF